MKTKTRGQTLRKKTLNRTTFMENLELWIMTLPGFLHTLIFAYIPMLGVIIAFKKFNPNLGIWGSKWVGFDNFTFFFTSNDFVRIMRNTIGYSFLFLFLDNFCAMGVAVMLYNVHKRAAIKYYQTTMILPTFMSMVLVAFIVYAFLNPVSGILNNALGLKVDWYGEAQYWPFILSIVHIWKSVGMSSILYYAALMGIDEALFEAARIDGATRKHEIFYIMVPELMNLICIKLILGIGGMISGDFGLHYQVTMNVGKLYSTTDIINTYTFRALQQATNMGRTAAIGLFQSITGTILVITSNAIIKKIDEEKSFF